MKLQSFKGGFSYIYPLSEYIETLIQELDTAILIERTEVIKLKENIAFYENEMLLNLFKEYENQPLKFVNAKGENIEIKISEPKDVYTVLINSFKSKK